MKFSILYFKGLCRVNFLLFIYSWLLNICLYLQITANLQSNLVAQLKVMHLASSGSSLSNPPPPIYIVAAPFKFVKPIYISYFIFSL
jgi:hypothetical protein